MREERLVRATVFLVGAALLERETAAARFEVAVFMFLLRMVDVRAVDLRIALRRVSADLTLPTDARDLPVTDDLTV